MQRPPQGVKLVIEAVCIMRGIKPKKVAGEKPGTKVDDYWEPGKGLLQDPGKFLESLFKFDKVRFTQIHRLYTEFIKNVFISWSLFSPGQYPRLCNQTGAALHRQRRVPTGFHSQSVQGLHVHLPVGASHACLPLCCQSCGAQTGENFCFSVATFWNETSKFWNETSKFKIQYSCMSL